MPASTSPIFTLTPRSDVVQVSTANALRDGTGTLSAAVAAGAFGTRIECITIKALVTTTTGTIRLFLFDGTNTRLFDEVLVSAVTVSATVAAFQSVYVPPRPLVIPSGTSLKFSTEKAELFNIIINGGDY